MNTELTVTRPLHISRRHRGRKKLRPGTAPEIPTGRVPRISRLMALAIRCEQLIRNGTVSDQSELAHFGQITTARMTQIMLLLNLAPDIQEQILFLPHTQRGRDLIRETDVRPIAATLPWSQQRKMWGEIYRGSNFAGES